MNTSDTLNDKACQPGVSAGRAAAYILAKGEGQYSEVDDSLFVHGFGGSIGRHFPLKCNWPHDALRFARREDAARVAKALGDGWRVRSVTLDAAEPYASTAQAADAARAEMKAAGNWPLVLPAKAPARQEPAFTPGPWRVSITEDGGCTAYYLDNTQGAETGEEEKANARLIAAAPALYAAIKAVLASVDCGLLNHGQWNYSAVLAVDAARAALAQADGKEAGR